MPPKPGDPLPDIPLKEGPDKTTTLPEIFQGKKGVLFGVPGAYTPGCSKQHLPGYVRNADKLHEKGAQEIVCVSVNDPYVMEAWGEVNGAQGKVRLLADPQGKLTHALGIEKEGTEETLGNLRMQRFSAVVEDNKFKTFNADPGTMPGELTCSLAEATMDQL